MRTLLHMVVGAIAGTALGIVVPVGIFHLFLWYDPVNMRQGGGTPFALFMIVTIPAGAICGAVWGLVRAHPAGEIVKRGSRGMIAQFDERFGDRPVEEQRAALALILPNWLRDYRKSLLTRIVFIVILIALIRLPLVPFILLGLLISTERLVNDMRWGIKSIRTRWGDEVVDQLAPLPYSLRLFSKT